MNPMTVGRHNYQWIHLCGLNKGRQPFVN